MLERHQCQIRTLITTTIKGEGEEVEKSPAVTSPSLERDGGQGGRGGREQERVRAREGERGLRIHGGVV